MERFSQDARQTLTQAQVEAMRFGHWYIGTEHLLLALVRVEGTVAARILAGWGVQYEATFRTLVAIIGHPFRPCGKPGGLSRGLTPRARRAIELAADEAQQQSFPYVGPEHLLLGIVRQDDGMAMAALKSLGVRVSLDDARHEVARIYREDTARSGTGVPLTGSTAAWERRREVARRVAQRFAEYRAVRAVLVFGSVATGYCDEQSDIDLLVISRSSVLPLPDRAILLSSFDSAWRFHVGPDRNSLFADQDLGGIIDGLPVEVHYQTAEWIEEVLDDVLMHGAITTERVPFRPYTLPALIQRSWVLLDRDGVARGWRERVRVYPRVLKANILRAAIPRLREDADDLVTSAERELGPRVHLFLLNRAVDALTSILYALNEIYDPAAKRAETAVLPTLAKAPADLIPILTDVLVGPFDARGVAHGSPRFHRLATEVLRMAEAELGS